jgi:hypothetical protein
MKKGLYCILFIFSIFFALKVSSSYNKSYNLLEKFDTKTGITMQEVIERLFSIDD